MQRAGSPINVGKSPIIMRPAEYDVDPPDASTKTLHASLGKLGFAKRPTAKFDDFFTPQNDHFYSTYRYLHLNPRRREFRLLKVHPLSAKPRQGATASWNNVDGTERMLHCEVVDKISLSNNYSSYCAISYAAGSHAQTTDILVDGLVFKAFANLVHAIQCALNRWLTRNPDRQFLIWVDQICINQSDPDERGRQVAMMGDIYRHCREAFVCLSAAWTPEDNIRDGFDWAKVQPHRSSAALYFAASPEDLSAAIAQRFGDVAELKEWVSSLRSFLNCTWWSRSWVYQEFVMAPSITFVYNQDSLSWKELSNLLRFFSDINNQKARICDLVHGNAPALVRQLQEYHDKKDLADPEMRRMIEAYEQPQRRIKALEQNLNQLEADLHLQVVNDQRERERERERKRDSLSRVPFGRLIANINSLWPEPSYQVRELEGEISRKSFDLRNMIKDEEARQIHSTRPRSKVVVTDLDRQLAELGAFFGKWDVRSKIVHILSVQQGKLMDPEARDLKLLLRHSRSCQASDARDRVYAFIGLVDATRYKVVPDYRWANTAVHVFTDAARKIIEHDTNLAILDHATRGRQDLGSYLPRWVPDWTCKEDNSVTDSYRYHLSKLAPGFTTWDDLDATKAREAHYDFLTDDQDQTRLILRVRGVPVDRLSEQGQLAQTQKFAHIRRFQLRNRGETAWCPKMAYPGDEIWAIDGLRWPALLRPEGNDLYTLLSLALVCKNDGLPSSVMFGGIVEEIDGSTMLPRVISLG